ncbi:gfo/Idh/MocA family oxidoreductase [Bremerella cremea]|uniref:Gfo/Idh/MocA family oxidoreductase n=1 Tax=Bremerella cremea TaxID=1031537 RepID=A0A368KXJ3_9BACT|nr:Gfo/Idh/MocA family oxidoreductase [Bremerella cremea]RCS56050.1 gfo/Idh/MocA family oxidoreductase [Bremerella cremea]
MVLRIGVVGLGCDWESRHRPALHSLQDRYKVEFICDEVALRARNAASQFNAMAPRGFRHAIDGEQIDAVFLLDQQWTGLLPLQSACAAGKAVYLNTALEMDAQSQQEVVRLVEATKVPFMIEFPRRFAPATIRLKELIATQLGRPKLIFCHHRLTPASCGSNPRSLVIQRSLAEIFDWCRYIVDGKPDSLFSVSYPRAENPSDIEYQMLSVDFQTKDDSAERVVAQISAGTYLRSDWPEAVSFRPPAAMQVCCENGIAFIDLPNTLIWFNGAGRHMESLEGERPVGERLFAAFHRLLENGNSHFDCLSEFRESTRVIQAARQSIAENRRIDF